MKKKMTTGMLLTAIMVMCLTMYAAVDSLAAGIDGVKWMEIGKKSLIGILSGERTFQVKGSSAKVDFYYRVLAQDSPSYPVWAGFLAHNTALPAQGGLSVEFKKKTFVTFNQENGEVIGGTLTGPAVFNIRVPETDTRQTRKWKLISVKFTPGDNGQPVTFSSALDEGTKKKITVVDCGTLAEDVELPNEKAIPFSWKAGTPVYVKAYGVARGQKSVLMLRHFKYFEDADNALK